MLLAENVCLRDDARELLAPMTISAAAGEFIKIVGGNGAGKTTLLKILCLMAPSDGGRLRWKGVDAAADADSYREELLYVGHQNGIADDLTPLENLRASALLRLRPPRMTFAKALADAGLGKMTRRRCRLLSAGQRRRAALARLRAFSARLWLLDEPLAALDAAGRDILDDWMAEHLATGGIAIATMHRAEDWPIAATREARCGATTA